MGKKNDKILYQGVEYEIQTGLSQKQVREAMVAIMPNAKNAKVVIECRRNAPITFVFTEHDEDCEASLIMEAERPHVVQALRDFLDAQERENQEDMHYAVFSLAAKLKLSRTDCVDIDTLNKQEIDEQIIGWINDDSEESQAQFELYLDLAIDMMQEVYDNDG